MGRHEIDYPNTPRTPRGQTHIFPTSFGIPLLTNEILPYVAREIIQQHFRIPGRELCGDTVLIVEVVGLSRGPIVTEIA